MVHTIELLPAEPGTEIYRFLEITSQKFGFFSKVNDSGTSTWIINFFFWSCILPFFKSCCPGTGGGILASVSCRVTLHCHGELWEATGTRIWACAGPYQATAWCSRWPGNWVGVVIIAKGRGEHCAMAVLWGPETSLWIRGGTCT